MIPTDRKAGDATRLTRREVMERFGKSSALLFGNPGRWFSARWSAVPPTP